jgi:ATP-dependent DNA helicase PIF1
MNELIEQKLKLLNEKQKIAFELMCKKKNVFISGMAGSGKSFIIKLFKKTFQNLSNIAITSTTGVSAILINGTTLHSFLGIGLGTLDHDDLVKSIYKNPRIKDRWILLDTLIIDEVSMLHPDLFDKLEFIAREIRQNRLPFGGIQLILSGDLLQLSPINSDKLCIHSNSWTKCKIESICLDQIMRQKDIEFQNCLNEIRYGIVSEKSKELLNNRINAKLTNEFNIKPTKLFAKNMDVDRINESELDNLAKEFNVEFNEYEMSFNCFGLNNKKTLIENFKKNTIVPINLQLCKHAQVMLLINLDVKLNLVNGSRGVIIDFVNDIPLVRFLCGKEILVNYFTWNQENNKGEIMLSATQIPLKIAYAVTINKIQGATLSYAEVDLDCCFAEGHVYVALSRVQSLNGLSIVSIDYDKVKANPYAIEFYNSINNCQN